MTNDNQARRDDSVAPSVTPPVKPPMDQSINPPERADDQADALDHFWDAVAESVTPPPLDTHADLTPERAATVAQVHNLATTQIPTGARSRVWQATLARANAAQRQQEQPPMRTASAATNGPPAITALPHATKERTSRRTDRGWWPRLEIAVAAVLIVGLLTTLLSPTGQERFGIFGTNDDEAEEQFDAFGGGGNIVEVPESENGHTLAFYELTLEPETSIELPPSNWNVRPVDGTVSLTRTGPDAEHTQVLDTNSLAVSDAHSTIRLSHSGNDPVTIWAIALTGGAALDIPTTKGTSVELLSSLELTDLMPGSLVELATMTRAGGSTPEPIAPRGQTGMHLSYTPDSRTAGIVFVAYGEVEVSNIGDQSADGPVTVPAGQSVAFTDGIDATVRGLTASTDDTSSPDIYLTITVRPVEATDNVDPQVASLSVDVPADAQMSLVLRRIELQPGAEWGYDFDGSVLMWAESGSATVSFPDDQMSRVITASEPAQPTLSHTGNGELRIEIDPAATEPTVLYQLLAFTGTDFAVALGTAQGTPGDGLVEVTNLAVTDDARIRQGQAAISLSFHQIDGGSQAFGTGSDFSVVIVTDGAGYVTSGVGEVFLGESTTEGRGDSQIPVLKAITGQHELAAGMTVTGRPGSAFSVGTESDQPLSVLVANVTPIEESLEAAATAVAGTPSAATPVADLGQPGCDVTPRTPDELVQLLEAGQANPVDPITLSLRDQAGTGTPADQESADAIMATLNEFAACLAADPTGDVTLFGLWSDDGLRALLPVSDFDADYLASLALATPAATDNSVDQPVPLLVSDIEIFPDGRVGARVSINGEYAYLTFSQEADGPWLIDVFDDRQAEERVPAATPSLAGSPTTATPDAASTSGIEAFGGATLTVPMSDIGHSIFAAEVVIQAQEGWEIPNAAAQIVVTGGSLTVFTDAEGFEPATLPPGDTITLEGDITLQAADRSGGARFLMLVIVGDGSWTGHPPEGVTTTPIMRYDRILLDSGTDAYVELGVMTVDQEGAMVLSQEGIPSALATPRTFSGTPTDDGSYAQQWQSIYVAEGEAHIDRFVIRSTDIAPSFSFGWGFPDGVEVRSTSDNDAVIWYMSVLATGPRNPAG